MKGYFGCVGSTLTWYVYTFPFLLAVLCLNRSGSVSSADGGGGGDGRMLLTVDKP